ARLRFPRLARVVVQVGHMMARLVAVRVLPDESGDIDLFAPRRSALSSKQLIELRSKLLLTTHQCDQTAHVLWNKERVLPRVRFSKSKRHFARIERFDPAAVAARAHEAGRAIEDVFVR